VTACIVLPSAFYFWTAGRLPSAEIKSLECPRSHKLNVISNRIKQRSGTTPLLLSQCNIRGVRAIQHRILKKTLPGEIR
jgi:hypothetical protein